MSAQTANFCIDAHDPYAQMLWWDQVLDDFTADPECAPVSPTPAGPSWPIQRATSSAC